MRELFNEHFRICHHDAIKNLNDLYRDSNIFASSLAHHQSKVVAIYLNDFYLFLVAFFGTLMSERQCVVLHTAPSDKSTYDLLICSDNIDDFLRDCREKQEHSLKPNALFYLQTSGSSGESKNIAKSIEQMLKEATFLRSFMEVGERHYFLSSVTHNHMYGMTFKVFLPLVCGGEVLAKELPFVELIFQALKPQDNILITSPTLLNALSQYPQTSILHSTQIISAGAKLGSDVWQRLSSLQILEIYGSTECGVMCYKRENSESLTRLEAVNLALKDECLVVESPWCETFYSNDLAEIKGDSVTLLGRADRIVKIADKRVSIDSIESCLNTLDIIASSRLDLLEGATHLSGIVALSQSGIEVFKRMGKREILNRITAFLKPQFGGILRYIYIRDTLPTNAQGKITKSAFKESLEAKITPSFHIAHCDDMSLVAHAKVPLSCFYFDWHFSNFPIVPGFIEVGFVVDLARHLQIEVGDMAEIIHTKWVKFIRPLDELEVRLELKETRLSFEILANGTLGASGKIHIHKAGK